MFHSKRNFRYSHSTPTCLSPSFSSPPHSAVSCHDKTFNFLTSADAFWWCCSLLSHSLFQFITSSISFSVLSQLKFLNELVCVCVCVHVARGKTYERTDVFIYFMGISNLEFINWISNRKILHMQWKLCAFDRVCRIFLLFLFRLFYVYGRFVFNFHTWIHRTHPTQVICNMQPNPFAQLREPKTGEPTNTGNIHIFHKRSFRKLSFGS